MSYLIHDPDEWEIVVESDPTSAGLSYRKRTPEAVLEIKRQKLREYEDKVLAEAETIRARRQSCHGSPDPMRNDA